MCVDDSLVPIVHGFEGFWRDAIETGCFSFFELGDGTFDFMEGDPARPESRLSVLSKRD